MKTIEEIKKILAKHKEKIEEKYGVEIVGIFGSYGRGEQSGISDVDILVEIKRSIGLKFFELWDYLETILGIKVDLLTMEAVKQKQRLWNSIKEDLVYV